MSTQLGHTGARTRAGGEPGLMRPRGGRTVRTPLRRDGSRWARPIELPETRSPVVVPPTRLTEVSRDAGMNPEPRSNVTLLLEKMDRDPAAPGQLLPLIYDELRTIARQRIRGERAGHTLQATALVHEAYVRLIGDAKVSWQSRAHFFGACANAMRQILVDHARARGARKRGGGLKPESLSAAQIADGQDLDLILSIDDCLDRLRAEDPRAAAVVELRFFSGLEMNEIAEALQISERTAHREWSFARVRLFQMLAEQDIAGGGEDSAA